MSDKGVDVGHEAHTFFSASQDCGRDRAGIPSVESQVGDQDGDGASPDCSKTGAAVLDPKVLLDIQKNTREEKTEVIIGDA